MEPKTTKKPSRKLVVFKRELPFYLMLIIFFPLPLTLPIPTFYFLIPNCSNFSPCFLTPNFSRRFPMAHTLLFSGYGAPGCDDLAVCRLTADAGNFIYPAAWPCPQLLLPGAKWLDLCRIGTRGWRGCDRLCAGRHDPARDRPH